MINPGQHGGSRDRAHVLAVEIGEAYAALGEGVEVGCTDFPPEAPEVGVAHVVGHDQKNVGLFCEQGSNARKKTKDVEKSLGGHEQIPIAKTSAVKR